MKRPIVKRQLCEVCQDIGGYHDRRASNRSWRSFVYGIDTLTVVDKQCSIITPVEPKHSGAAACIKDRRHIHMRAATTARAFQALTASSRVSIA
jgi:hypothetical protein